jgi:hypothetical protein
MKISELLESPQMTLVGDKLFKSIMDDMEGFRADGIQLDLGNNLYKLETLGQLFYWEEVKGVPMLAVHLEKDGEYLTVRGTGKNKASSGRKPYADDLYLKILKDNPTKKILSDNLLTVGGYKIWDRLRQKRTVSAVDRRTGNTNIISSSEELLSYFSIDTSQKHIQYLIS